MDLSEELDHFAKSICDAVRRHEYSELEPIMQDIFLKRDKLVLLASLSNRLPSGAFQDFFLCGLTYLVNLSSREFKKLFELSSGHDIAIYNLTRFLIIHGGAKKKALQALCVDFSEIEKVDQFNTRLAEDSRLPLNEDKMNRLYYKEFKIPQELIETFKEKFATVGAVG